MRYIKKFDTKKNKKKVKTSNLDWIEDYKNRCNDIDEKSEITFDQFYDNLDFSSLNQISIRLYEKNKAFSDAGINLSNPNNNSNRFTIDGTPFYTTSEYKGSSNSSEDSSLEEWQKRNIFIWVDCRTGGASGGSCYDEGPNDGARPYEGESMDYNDFIYDYLKYVFDDILIKYAPDKTSTELCDILYSNYSGIVRNDSRTNYEYYGNYDNYECYWITLEDLFLFITQNTSL